MNVKCKLIVAIVIFILLSIAFSTNASAVYQSRPGFSALVNTTAEDFFEGIREMETSTGSMGLSATLSSDYTATGNNIDVHMIKNSEWGAVAMLALSGYGGGSQDTTTTYTTGSSNYTGVYGMGNSNWEYTMSTTVDSSGNINATSTYASFLSSVNSIYYDKYYWETGMTNTTYDKFYSSNYSLANSSSYFSHFGDTIYETKDIISSSLSHYVTYASIPFFARGSYGVLASSSYSRSC